MLNSICEVLCGIVYLFFLIPFPCAVLLFTAERAEKKRYYISERKKLIHKREREYQSRLYRAEYEAEKRCYNVLS